MVDIIYDYNKVDYNQVNNFYNNVDENHKNGIMENLNNNVYINNLFEAVIYYIKENDMFNINNYNIDDINILSFIFNNNLLDQYNYIEEEIELNPAPYQISILTEASICSICLENIEIDTECIVTECNHVFHGQCFQPWVMDHNTCPNCRHEF